MGEVYQGLGLYKTSSQLFDELEQSKLTANLDPLRRLRFLNSYAETSYNSGDYAKAKALMYGAEPLLRLDATATDPVERGRARNIMSQLAMQDNDAAAAEVLLAKNLEELSRFEPGHAAAACVELFHARHARSRATGRCRCAGGSRVFARTAPRGPGRRSSLGRRSRKCAGDSGLQRRQVPGGRAALEIDPAELSQVFRRRAPGILVTAAELRADRPGARQFRGSREALPPIRRHRPQGQGAGPRRLRLFAQLAGPGRTGARPHARRPRPTSTKASRSRASIGIACARRCS